MTALRAIVGSIVLTLLGHANLALSHCPCGCGDTMRVQQ